LYENQAHVDQLVDAVGQRSGDGWPDRTGQATDAVR
jgi:hypothetical protein